jgi:hypothetical protein
LPSEVEPGHVQQDFAAAVREFRPELHVLSAQVHVRVHRPDFDVFSEAGFRLDLLIAFTWRNYELGVRNHAGAQLVLRRFLREDEPDPGASTPSAS